jgi:hypothetical protein
MACDTVDGICAWWLPEEGLLEDRVLVEEALDRLVDREEVSRVELADGTRLYAAPDGDGGT